MVSPNQEIVMSHTPLRGNLTAFDLGSDRPYTFEEIAKITAGAVASLVIVGWTAVLALAFLTVG
jgi:hypothetical protein